MLQEYYNDEELSLRLQKIIKDNKHTMTSLGKEAGVPESTVRNLCNADTSFNPNLKTLHKLSKALGVDLTEELYKED